MNWKAVAAGFLTMGVLAAGAIVPTLGAENPGLSSAAIDNTIRAEWKKENVIPAPPVDDARFLRRVYLDITGTIPTEQTVRDFLADRTPTKRVKAIDSLLASDRYATYWAGYWDQALMGRQVRNNALDRVAWRDWLHDDFAKNLPYNRFVFDLLTATGVNSTGGSYAKVMGLKVVPGAAMVQQQATPAVDDAAAGAAGGGRVNGAVNWFLKFQNNVADLAGQSSKVFLGVQIQCAQCHDHKTEKWKQEDFRKFAACFVATRPRPVGTPEKGMIRRVDLEDFPRLPRFGARMNKKNDNTVYLEASPAAIDGTTFAEVTNRRQALAAWMTAPENPWFAEAIVNRMWAHFLGRGFVDPIDDFRPSNPPVLPGLLKKLADDFVAHDYDLKHLVKLICSTQAYQLSSAPARSADPQNRLWARYRLKAMGPEELMDSLVTATDLGPVLERVAGANLDALKFAMQRQFTFLFDVDEEFEQKDFEGTIPQALLLLNGNITNRAASPIPGTALAQVLSMPGDDRTKVESFYLRTFSRMPTQAELGKWTQFVQAPREAIITEGPPPSGPIGRRAMMQGLGKKAMKRNNGPDPLARFAGRMNVADATPKTQAYEDLFWALLNSSEFTFNH